MRVAVERYLLGTHSEVELALMESYPQEWLGELWTMYLESVEKGQRLQSEQEDRMVFISGLGRDGRTLAAMTSAKYEAACLSESKNRLKIERAIETVGRIVALRKGEEAYRAALVEYLLDEIKTHRESLKDQDCRPEDERLWSLLKE